MLCSLSGRNYLTKEHNLNFINIIIQASLLCNIPPKTIEAIVRVESNYCLQMRHKVSSARGAMQVLIGNMNVFDLHDARDCEASIVSGTKLLCSLKARFPNTLVSRWYIGPHGDIHSEKTRLYLDKIKKRNKYFN